MRAIYTLSEKHYPLAISETLSDAFKKCKGFKKNFWLAFVIFFVIKMACEVGKFVSYSMFPNALSIKLLFFVFSYLISAFLGCGMLYLGIRHVFNHQVKARMIFYAFKPRIFIKLIALFFIQIIIFFTLSIVLFCAIMPFSKTLFFLAEIIMALYIGVRMILSPAFIMDKKVEPVEAICMSIDATSQNFWNTCLFVILKYLIVLMSIIPLGIGLIWTMPFVIVASGMLYKNLSQNLVVNEMVESVA